MSFSSRFVNTARYILPAPFTIAIILTLVTFYLAFFTTKPAEEGTFEYYLHLVEIWEDGLWNPGLMVFAMQMMLILVLGHVLALTKPFNALITYLLRFCTTTASAAAIVTLLTVLVALFNWGLGLIFGAIFARKVGEYAVANKLDINYPLIGAAGYSGLMVWHGGISGSATTKIAESGHIRSIMSGIYSEEQITNLPESITFIDTVFGGMNITVAILLIVLLPLMMYFLGRSLSPVKPDFSHTFSDPEMPEKELRGAEKLDHSGFVAIGVGAFILLFAFYKAFIKPDEFSLGFITPNYINFVLLGLGLIMHGSFFRFLYAVEQAIGGAAGILIQFPLYFGIMGIINQSGLVVLLSDFFVQISNTTTFPVFTFFSAGLLNIFVPSGGGQWAVQGPIIVEAANQLNVPLAKSVMAMAYGDQLTNMLQPFWALPLLGITGLKAKDILPYSLILLLAGLLIFVTSLLIF